MKKIFLPFMILICLIDVVDGQKLPTPVTGEIIRHEDFPSELITPRNVDVWLPQGYSTDNSYPVLYMHDGQNLFDSTVTWNNQEWMVDEIITRLTAANKMKKTIVVGIWNIPEQRHPEFFPEKVVDNLSESDIEALSSMVSIADINKFKAAVGSDNYLSFIVKELKPFIDENYSTSTKREDTYVAGASMGGLMSMYALCEYPETFGAAACISTHWPGINDFPQNPLPKAFAKYLEENLPEAGFHRIYFDYGNKTLDESYGPHQKIVDQVMNDRGYKNYWKTEFFDGHDHSERSWQKRFDQALLFLVEDK